MYYHDGNFVFPILRGPVEHCTILGKVQYSRAVAKAHPPTPAPRSSGPGSRDRKELDHYAASWLSYIFNKLVQTNHQPILAETFKITSTWGRVLARNLSFMHCFKWHLGETLGGLLKGTLSLEEYKKIIK